MVLLQTIIMSLIMAFIAVSIMNWVLSRYLSAVNTSKSAVARGRSGGYAMTVLSNPATEAVSGDCNIGNVQPDGATVGCDKSGDTITITYDYEQ